jgi:hypothetical protein
VPYLLDGDNVVGSAHGRRATADDRNALAREVSDRLRRTKAKVVLFFDGAGTPVSLGNLSVRFSGSMSADDAIVREVSRASRPGETAVVTADRELARRARDAGARTVSPEHFWERFGVREAADRGRSEPTRVDVEDWERWFSDQKKNEE